MKKVHIGLDLGIASVGWSLVDEQQNIIAMGSHLFPKLSSADDYSKYGEGERGKKRRTRRMLRRKKQRKLDFLNMIDINSYNNQLKINSTNKPSSLYKEKYQTMFGFNEKQSSTDFLFQEAHKYDIYKIYKDGFNRELGPKELFLFLYFKLSFRGVFFLSFNKPETYSYNDSLLKNIFEDIYFKKEQKYRNKSNGDEKFSIYWNWYEIEFILKKQSYIDDEFINDYKGIFMRLRHFSKGPGFPKDELLKFDNKYASKWGIKFDQNGKPLNKNLWENKIGYCPISLAINNGDKNKAELKCSSLSLYPDIIKFIDQIININISRANLPNTKDKFNKLDLIKIIDYFILNDLNPTITRIADDVFKIDKENISNYPLTKDRSNSNFHTMNIIRQFFNKEKPIINFDKGKITSIFEIYEELNELQKIRIILCEEFYCINKEKKDKSIGTNNINLEKSKIVAKDLVNSNELLNDNSKFNINYDNLCDFSLISEQQLSCSNNFGLSSYNEYFDYFVECDPYSCNLEMFNVHFRKQIIDGKKRLYDFDNSSKYPSLDMFKLQEFLSPNVKNTMKETIRVLKKILKQYIYKNDYELESIMIETTWQSIITNKGSTLSVKDSLYSKSYKNQWVCFQKYFEKLKEEAKKELKDNNIEATNQNIKKVCLLIEQKWNDAYTGSPIHISQIEQCQIDHIIPESISHNNFWENLVLSREANSDKGKQIPKEYKTKEEFDLLVSKWKSWYGIKTKNKKDDDKKINEDKNKKENKISEILNKKFNYLTSESICDSKCGFINSNLCETTYAISKICEGLSFFIENFKENYSNKNGIEYSKISNCQVRTLSGYYSHYIREIIDIQKNREFKDHHAHDASLCAIFSSMQEVSDFYNKYIYGDKKYFIYECIKEKKYNYIPFLGRNKIEQIFSPIKDDIKKSIENTECIFSFKRTSILPYDFYKKYKTVQEQEEFIRNIKPKQIFSNENYETYMKDDKGIKHKIIKWKLMSDKDGEKINVNNNILLPLISFINEQQITKYDHKLMQHFCDVYNKKYKILTHPKILWDIFTSIKILSGLEIKEKDENNYFKSYKQLINEDKILLNMKTINGNIINEEYMNNLYKNDNVPLIRDDIVYTIKYIKVMSNDKYSPMYERAEFFNKSNSNKNNILNNKQSKHLSRNTCLYGNNTKIICIKQLQQKNKVKTVFLKMNQLNQVLNDENNSKTLKFIDYDKWFKVNNNIYRLSDFHIRNNGLTIHDVIKNRDVTEAGSFSSFEKKQDDEEIKLIFEYLKSGL